MQLGELFRHGPSGHLWTVGMTRDGERVWVLVAPIEPMVHHFTVRPLWWFPEDLMKPAPAPARPRPPVAAPAPRHMGRVDVTLVNIDRPGGDHDDRKSR